MDGAKENPQVGRTLGADINTNRGNYNTLSPLEAGLAYSRRGWRVFPVHSMSWVRTRLAARPSGRHGGRAAESRDARKLNKERV